MAEYPSSVARAADRKGRRFRALRPLFAWVFGFLLLLGWQLYRRAAEGHRITFNVLIGGQPATENLIAVDAQGFRERLAVSLDGEPFVSGSLAHFGTRKLKLESPATEPIEKKISVWFRDVDLGAINVERSKGALEIETLPTPEWISVLGKFFNTTNTGVTAELSGIPVGEYQVAARFSHSTETRKVKVHRNEKSRLEIKPNLGCLELATEPAGGEFALKASSLSEGQLSETTPALLSELPAGAYQVRVWRGDYVKELALEIKAGETNRLNVVFEYGEVRVTTKPEGASLFEGTAELGKAPTVITGLKPGEHRFHLQLENYAPLNLIVSVAGKQTILVSTNLFNLRYYEALTAARSLFGKNLRDALTRVDEALRAEPGDPEATSLKEKIQARLHEEDTRLAEEQRREEARRADAKRKADEDARNASQQLRKQEAEQAFRKATAMERDANVFETYVWPIKGDVQKTREALLRLVQEPKAPWKLLDESQRDNAYLFHFGGKGILGAKGKHATVLVAQLSPEEVSIFGKFWDYYAGSNLSFTLTGGLTADSLVPGTEVQRKAVAEDFKARLMRTLK